MKTAKVLRKLSGGTRHGSGKVGSFVDYLNEADTVYVTEKMHTELSSYYGYRDI
jgi:hypothetical protein